MIQSVDRRLVRLLARRRDLVVVLMVRKRQHGLHLVDPAQERRVLLRAVQWAKELGIPGGVTSRWFALIVAECKRQALRPARRGPGPVGKGAKGRAEGQSDAFSGRGATGHPTEP